MERGGTEKAKLYGTVYKQKKRGGGEIYPFHKMCGKGVFFFFLNVHFCGYLGYQSVTSKCDIKEMTEFGSELAKIIHLAAQSLPWFKSGTQEKLNC